MLTVSLWDSCLSIENSDNEAINILTVSLWVSLWDPSFGPDEKVDGLIVGPLFWALYIYMYVCMYMHVKQMRSSAITPATW